MDGTECYPVLTPEKQEGGKTVTHGTDCGGGSIAERQDVPHEEGLTVASPLHPPQPVPKLCLRADLALLP